MHFFKPVKVSKLALELPAQVSNRNGDRLTRGMALVVVVVWFREEGKVFIGG